LSKSRRHEQNSCCNKLQQSGMLTQSLEIHLLELHQTFQSTLTTSGR
jgi:hypothetical protein